MFWFIVFCFIVVVNKWYFIIFWIINRNDFDIVFILLDNDFFGGFVVLKKKIVVIKKKIKLLLFIIFEVFLKIDLKKKLFINYKLSLVFKFLFIEGVFIIIMVIFNGKW